MATFVFKSIQPQRFILAGNELDIKMNIAAWIFLEDVHNLTSSEVINGRGNIANLLRVAHSLLNVNGYVCTLEELSESTDAEDYATLMDMTAALCFVNFGGLEVDGKK